MSEPDSDAAELDSVADERGESEARQDVRSDGGEELQTHTIRLELIDEPGQLLNALKPIADNGGNLLSIFHERGNVTPRGRIPVEVDLECPPGQFDRIVEALQENGINVMQAGPEHYGEEATLLLIGHLIETDLSDTLGRIEECANASVQDISIAAGDDESEVSSARLRLATRTGKTRDAIRTVRTIAEEKGFRVVEPQEGAA